MTPSEKPLPTAGRRSRVDVGGLRGARVVEERDARGGAGHAEAVVLADEAQREVHRAGGRRGRHAAVGGDELLGADAHVGVPAGKPVRVRPGRRRLAPAQQTLLRRQNAPTQTETTVVPTVARARIAAASGSRRARAAPTSCAGGTSKPGTTSTSAGRTAETSRREPPDAVTRRRSETPDASADQRLSRPAPRPSTTSARRYA
ncbi:hypothetical protein [Streptomyces sp. NPDC003006]